MLTDLLILASEGAEGISGDHIASKIAVPIAIVIFCGAVFALLWSNHGAKKGALIYSTAMFGFTMMLGVFWWFGAPGTPTATGLQNFPGQANDQYQAKWYGYESGSERDEVFDADNDLQGNFQTPREFLDMQDVPEEELENRPAYGDLSGALSQAGDIMMDLFMRADGNDINLGGERRAEYAEAGEQGLAEEVGADAAEGFDRADPFYTAAIAGDQVLVTEDRGVRLAGAEVQVFTNFVNEDGETVEVQVDQQPMFAFQQGSNLWFPSAVWTLVSLLLFVLSLAALDRVEQREKRTFEEVAEPERLATPIRQ